jgi:hypothetical protein
MGFALQIFPARIQRSTVLCKLHRHAKNLKIVGQQVHGMAKNGVEPLCGGPQSEKPPAHTAQAA